MGKVRFGLSNVHYAVLDVETGQYETPVRVPGAVEMTTEYEGETSNFYADNVVYETFATSSSITGTISFAAAENQMLIDLLGFIDDGGVLLEDLAAQPTPFALLFEVDGNIRQQRSVLYSVKLSRPNEEHKTREDTVEPDVVEFDFTAISREMDVLGEKRSIARATVENGSETKAKYDAFMSEVYTPTADAAQGA